MLSRPAHAAGVRRAALALETTPAPVAGAEASARSLAAPDEHDLVSRTVDGTARAYKRATAAFDTTEPLRPWRAVVATSVEDVQAAVLEARSAGVGVRMHSTGHAAGSSSDMTGEILVRTALGGAVTVDAERRLVRIPAGTPWGVVVAAAAKHGLAVPHGSSGHVGAIGYLSRGGLSAYARTVGVAANSVESVELVTADGRLVVASRDCEPDLFWAVRGGGGGFGVITAMTVRAFGPGTVVTGTALWEIEDARGVADAWAAWTASAPNAITTALRVMGLPPLPGMPLRLGRRPLLVIDGTAVDHGGIRAEDAAGDLLHVLRRAARPVFDSWRRTETPEVAETHMDPPVGAAHRADHMLLGASAPAPAEGATHYAAPLEPADVPGVARNRAVVETFLGIAARPDSGLPIAELRQLRGALAETPEDAGAVGRFDADFAWFTGAMVSKKHTPEEAADKFAAAREAFGRWDTGFTAPTFAADRDRPQRNYDEAARVRVEAVREAVDPTGVFRGDVAVGALAH
ncbi:FAD-binding protein [Agromyces sp. MMS17-SY077]|uniref:FAD-binding protein n=1 Tax=Agromyces seonyuensis TaxID=2662446 RepID=A0A6I4P1H9_9MICO|nr:FAD-binding protein [Agromyces seonyuensis]